MPENDQKHLSEVIDYDTDIAPYQFIKIYAGIGSGKNTFIDNLVKGDKLKHKDGSFVEKQNVLLVTSRRSKADEQRNLDDVTYDSRVGMYDYYDDPFSYFDDDDLSLFMSEKMSVTDEMGDELTIRLRSCCCTNAQIEKMWHVYAPQATQTHPWERFDIIVIDEVHAVLADASYQSAPFYVRRLIEMTLAKSCKCKVIVMTGSPEILDDYHLFDDAHCVNCMDRCINLMPERVVFMDFAQAIVHIKDLFSIGEKIIYFSNTINSMLSLVKMLSDFKEDIAVSFSDKEKRANLKHNDRDLFDAMVKAEKNLAINKCLPDNIYLFLSTSKNKEGVNIENEDIKSIFVEAHSEQDIKQMVGRLRNGVRYLYVIADPKLYNDAELDGEESFSFKSDLLNTINHRYLSLCEEAKYYRESDNFSVPQMEKKLLSDYIGFIHEKFPYIRFDFATDNFVYYPERSTGRLYYTIQNEHFDSCRSKEELIALANTWFPEAECYVETRFFEDARVALREYLISKKWLDTKVRNEHKADILNKINELAGSEFKQLKRALNKLRFDIQDGSKNSKYGNFTITEL